MPHRNFSNHHNHGQYSISIRDELEYLAKIQNPGLSRRMGKRLATRTGKKNCRTQKPEVNRTQRVMRWQDRTLLTLVAVLVTLFAVRTQTAIASEPEWGLRLQTDAGAYTQMAIDTDMQIDITGLVARVSVTQHFTNHGNRWAEAIYRFPLPQGAAVDRMLIKVGERVLEGEIQERQAARRVYQKARDSGQTASLVEQQRRNQFQTSLANIAPGESIEITLSYLQQVDYADFSYHLRIPMTFTARWTPGQKGNTEPNPIPAVPANNRDHSLKLHANLVTAVEFAAIESRYHDVDIRLTDDGYQISLLNPFAVTDRDFELSWTPALQSRPTASLMTYNDGDAVYAQLMLAPPIQQAIRPVPREVILIIDTSGSMEGASLRQAKAALLHALKSIGTDDRFNLLQFNSVTDVLFDRSVAATGASLNAAETFISGLEAGGGTNMEPALMKAMTLPIEPHLMRQIVFITDGAVGNETELLQLIAENLGDSRLFTVAIGHAPNSWFMRKAAEIGRGSHIHIGKPTDVEARMSALWTRIQTPALTNICIDWGMNAEYYPEIIPDLYAGEPLWLLARLPGEPTIIDLCGRFNDQDWNLSVNAWDAASGIPGGDNLANLWARKKIEALEDGLMFGADRELTQLEITGLALDFGLLTRHTSLVAVDKTPRRNKGQALAKSDIPGLLPAGTASHSTGFPSTATGWLSQLLLSVFVLLLATSLLVFSSVRLPVTRSST